MYEIRVRWPDRPPIKFYRDFRSRLTSQSYDRACRTAEELRLLGAEAWVEVVIPESVSRPVTIQSPDLGYWTEYRLVTCLECAKSYQVAQESGDFCPRCGSGLTIARNGVLRPAPVPLHQPPHIRWLHSRFFTGYIVFPEETHPVNSDIIVDPPEEWRNEVAAVMLEFCDEAEFRQMDYALSLVLVERLFPESRFPSVVRARAVLAGFPPTLRGCAQFISQKEVRNGTGGE